MSFANDLIDKNREAWISRLIDTGRRNNLLYFQPEGSDKVFSISDPGDDGLQRLLKLEPFSPLKNLKGEEQKKPLSILRQIQRRARINMEERSIDTLYMALGVFRWPSADGGRDFCAPALLLPIEMKREEGAGRSIKLQLKGEVEWNRSMLVLWKKELNIDLGPVENRIDSLDPDGPVENWVAGLEELKSILQSKASVIPGITFENGAWLSNFSFQKIGLVQDLESHRAQTYQHPLVAALCGDPDARLLFQNTTSDFAPQEIDSLSAEDDFTFLPCDSSQFTVIRNVLQGKSGVIQGPPGTGKSQVIANLIAELVARGKRVLFVAEKKAALDVVFDRLNKGGLGDIVLNLHGGDMRGKKLADQLYRGLEVLRSPAAEPGNHTLGEWERVRQELVDHVHILHTPWKPWNLSPYTCMDWLMGHPEVPHPGLRIQSSSLEQVTPDLKREMMELLTEYAALQHRLKSTISISWKNAVADPGEKTLSVLDTLQDIAGHIRILRTWYEENRSNLHLEVLERRTQLQNDSKQLLLLQNILPLFHPEALNKDIKNEIAVLETYKGKGLKQFAGGLFSSSYKQAVNAVKSLFIHSVDLFNEALPALEKLRSIQDHWKGNPPASVLKLDVLSKESGALEEAVRSLAGILPGMVSLDNWAELEVVVNSLLEKRDNVYLVPKLLQLQKALSTTGMDSFILQCEQAGIPGEQWSSSFEQLYYRSVLGIMKSRDMRIAAFDGRRQDEKRMLFRELDKKRQTLAVSRIRRLHAERMTGLMNRFPDQENVLRSQSQRKHPWPFKRIFREAPDVLLSVFPCWMASPLTVTQFLSANNTLFDVVFFDEASQVQPADAISSILRGKQLVVSGDTRQLPPTSFFADGEERSEVDEQSTQPSTSGYESLLHLLLGTLPGLGPAGDGWFLRWHYRSRDESLIAFSNEHIYNGRMVTFPRPSTEQAVHFIQVDPAVNSDVGQESSTSEVLKVAEQAVDIARKHPDKSLGIIALGIEHALRLEEAIEKAIENLEEETRLFFSESRKEPFFVKNLERVQGDERDIVILSIGYGQNRSGTLSHNFGPINQEGGERRLNVAITRSREQMWVVASFDPAELNPERTKGLGPGLLRKYMMYAKSGGRNLGLERPTGTEENFFERDIREALQTKGLQITPQYGVSGYRIDLVVHHPEKPGEFIMAIECDGATYHSAPCARDRDRLRQEFLEGMGWNFHRIWSTDWFTRREEEIERALHRYRVLIEESKTEKKENSAPPIQAPTPLSPVNPDEKMRGKRPPIPEYESIQDYHDSELFLLAQWILSDGILRTDQVLFEELFDQLGFRRKGTNITQRLNDIIQRLKG